MDEINLGGSISLVGFDVLEPVELAVVKKLVGNFVRKLTNQVEYSSLRLELKQHKKGKTFLHEINGEAEIDKHSLGAKAEDYNLYACLNKVSEKLIAEASHRKRTTRESGKEMIKKQQKIEEKEESEESLEL